MKKEEMTKNFSPNRRSFIRGAAWSAPVVLASATVPAYAASKKYSYYITQSQTNAKGTVSRRYYTDVTTKNPANGDPAGFTVGSATDPGEATATLVSLDYYVAIPANAAKYGVTNLNSSVSGLWTEPQRVDVSTLPLNDGSTLIPTGYYVYKMSFLGDKTNSIKVEGQATTWPNTMVSLRFLSDSAANKVDHIYAGYVTSVTLDPPGRTYSDYSMIEKRTR